MAGESPSVKAPVDVPPGFWEWEASHHPKPLTPLGSSFLLDSFNQAWPKIFEEFGVLLESLEQREIGGYVYQKARPFGGRDSGGHTLPPKPIMWLLLRLHPAFRRRIARCKEAMGARLDRSLVERWYGEWRPRLIADIDRWRSVDLMSLPGEDLAVHLRDLREWMLNAASVHFNLAVAQIVPLALLTFFCRDRLGYGDQQVLPLFSGLSGASSEPALELAKLADTIRPDVGLTEAVLAAGTREVPALLAKRRADVAAKFQEHLHHYGYRALRYEVAEESLAERPELVASLLQDELRRPTGLEAQQQRLSSARVEAKAIALAALKDDGQREEFLTLLADAERGYPIREDNEFFTISVPLALARFAFLEAGKRLAASGVVAIANDIFFLRYDEVISALVGRDANHQELAAGRREEYTATQAFDPPASYGRRPPTPPLDVLPPEARLAMEVSAFSIERVFEPERSGRREESSAREVRGIGASRGTYTGPARIILGEEQFDKLQAGDVLVCPVTSPVWSILFAKVGALVTDSGGILSHPAIIAREYGIPAVVATGNATGVIPDGQQIVVDGEAGVVRVLG